MVNLTSFHTLILLVVIGLVSCITALVIYFSIKIARKSSKNLEKRVAILLSKGFSINKTPSQDKLSLVKDFVPTLPNSVIMEKINYVLTGNFKNLNWEILDYSYRAIAGPRVSHWLVFLLKFDSKTVSNDPDLKTSQYQLPIMTYQNMVGTRVRTHVVYYQGIEKYLNDIADTLDSLKG